MADLPSVNAAEIETFRQIARSETVVLLFCEVQVLPVEWTMLPNAPTA